MSPLIVISTIKHKAWQTAIYLYLRAILLIVVKMFRERLD